MERFLIKKEPYWPHEIEEVVNIYNHSPIDEKPNNIKLEFVDNNTSSTPISFGNYFETDQELNCSYEGHERHEVKSNDLEKSVNIDNLSLMDEKTNNIKLENIDQNTCSTPIFSEEYFKIKKELDCSQDDHFRHKVNNAGSDVSLSKLRNAIIVLERLSIVQILKLTKKSETDSDCTRLNVNALQYVCKYSCSKCDRPVDTKNICHIISRPECGCIPTLAYQCMGCNKQFVSYESIQKHVNTKGLCRSRKRFLHLEGFNDDEGEKLSCPKCNESLENISKFTKHVNNCEEVPKFWCSLCDYGGKSLTHFRSHLKLHVSKSTQSKCFSAEELGPDQCDRKRKRSFNFKTTVCYCSTCDKTLVTRGFKISSSVCNKCGTSYTYRCSKCDNEYTTHSNANRHIAICKTSKDYRCSICKGKEFASIYQLKTHMSHCGKTPDINCKFCPYKTKRRIELQNHLKRHFQNDRSFIDQTRVKGTDNAGPLDYELFCKQCSESRENGEFRKDYYYCLTCQTKLLLQCRKCNIVYKSYRGLMAHMTYNCGLEIESELQKCPKCDRQLKNLNLHINRCRDLTKYCAHCPYNTKHKSYLRKHLFRNHQDEWNFNIQQNGPTAYDMFCEQCSEPKENGEYRKNSYYCLKCKTKLMLQCQKCKKVYKSHGGMRVHITSKCKLRIDQSELEKCPKCGRQFKILNLHIDSCRDLTKYCAHCPYNTISKSHLIRHLFSQHQDEGNFRTKHRGPLYDLFCVQCNEPKENSESRVDCKSCLKCNSKLFLRCRKCERVFKLHKNLLTHITSNCGLKTKGVFLKSSIE